MSDDDFTIYACGVVSASVCTSLPLDEAMTRLNRELPTGISSQWSPATEETFAGGEPQPGECETLPGYKHYLFHC